MVFKKITILVIVLTGLVIMPFESNFSNTAQTSDLPLPNIVLEGYEPIVVLELFTSQGCSSCPAADNLLNQINNDFDTSVFPLSYHVDYWNYIGWKDPFSTSQYGEKQKAYNIKFKNRSNYTPQVVVNGMEHLVGSNSVKLYGAVNTYSQEKAMNKITLANTKLDTRSISFQYGVLGSTKNKKLRALLVLDHRTTDVKSGENRNRKLANSNIVVAEKIIPIDGLAGESFMSIPEIVNQKEKISLILLIESKDYDITGAAKISLINQS